MGVKIQEGVAEMVWRKVMFVNRVCTKKGDLVEEEGHCCEISSKDGNIGHPKRGVGWPSVRVCDARPRAPLRRLISDRRSPGLWFTAGCALIEQQ